MKNTQIHFIAKCTGPFQVLVLHMLNIGPKSALRPLLLMEIQLRLLQASPDSSSLEGKSTANKKRELPRKKNKVRK